MLSLSPYHLAVFLLNSAFLANQAKKQGVQHVLFTSSTSVFPDISGQFDESSQRSAETEMGKTLIQAEQCLFQSGISHCDILRLAGLIGKQRHPVKFLAGKHNLKQGYSPVNLVHLEDCILTIFARQFILLEQNITQKQRHFMIYPYHNLNVVIRIRNESLWQIKFVEI